MGNMAKSEVEDCNVFGGGSYNCVLVNNTFYKNEVVGIETKDNVRISITGGGVYQDSFYKGIIYNCIFGDNKASNNPNVCSSDQPFFSAWPEATQIHNNIILKTFPFINNNDLRLSPFSLCINAGDTTILTNTLQRMQISQPWLDNVGKPRIINEHVDIGAYGYNFEF
jgi:hypothetical protein